MKYDIYQTDRRVESCFERLEKSGLSEKNVELLQEFYRDALIGDLPGRDLEKITVQGNLECFKIISHELDFDLETADRETLKDLVMKINQGEIHPERETSCWTLLDYKRALKNFYKWLYDSEDPKVLDFMSVYIPDSKKPRVDPDELLTVGDAEKLINSAFNSRDKALFGLLWDSGARISEVLSLNVKDITFQDELMGVNIREGKTGPRKIYLVESIPLIRNWLKDHPTGDPEDPLFTILQSSNSTSSGVRRQSYRSAASQLNSAASRTSIPERKRWNPHGWRRARATDMAKRGMNQPNMNAFFGWVAGSDVPKYYIRLAQRDVERSIRQLYPGLEEKEEETRYLGQNIPEYDQTDLRAYQESS